jgi:hypothetical protein
MSNERGAMNKAKVKSCLDCLHCKVSAKSTANNRLCYCAKEGKEERPQKPFWSEKKVCGEFYGMGSHITMPPQVSRRPLLKGADFLGGLSRR